MILALTLMTLGVVIITATIIHHHKKKPAPTTENPHPTIAKAWTGQKVHWTTPGPHTVVCGVTRTGKSVGCYTILGKQADLDHVAVVGIDPSGRLLNPWTLGPNADDSWYVLSTSDDDLNRALDLLQLLVEIMDHRIATLTDRQDKLDRFTREKPIIYVVLEEYAGLITSLELFNKKLKTQAVAYVGRLLREGAKAGIVVVTILQRPEAAVLHDRAQYSRHTIFRLDNSDSVGMVAQTATDEAQERVLTLPPGRALYLEAGEPEKLATFPHLDYADYVDHVTAHNTNTLPEKLPEPEPDAANDDQETDTK